MAPGIDLVVTDLDGTLWDHNVELHPTTRSALDTLAREGVPVLAATGRRKASALRGFDRAAVSFPAVTVNGAFGFLPATGENTEVEFHRHPFEVEFGLGILEIYRRFGHVPVAYNLDGTTHLSPNATTSAKHIASFGDDAVHAEPEEAMNLGAVVGLSLIGLDDRETLRELGAALQALDVPTDPYTEAIYGGWSISAQPPGVNKWLGVQRYCEFAGLNNPRVLALGDGSNDVELLSGADVSLGIDGGESVALAVADVVVPPPEGGGWAKVLDYL